MQRTNRFTVALSGGRSPMEFYCKLSALKDFDLWSRTHIFLGDERFVPSDDSASNFKMIKENLLDYVNIPPENIHPISTDQKNVELSAEQFKNELVQFFEFKEFSKGHGRVEQPAGGFNVPVNISRPDVKLITELVFALFLNPAGEQHGCFYCRHMFNIIL